MISNYLGSFPPSHILLTRSEAEQRKTVLFQLLSVSQSHFSEFVSLSKHLTLMDSGIHEISTANYSYKINATPENELMLGGGLEDMLVNASVKLISSGIEILIRGNKSEITQSQRQDSTVPAKMKVGNETISGTYTGEKIVKKEKYSFLCFCPVYSLVATGQGEFHGKEISYKGIFYENLFHDLTGKAEFHIGIFNCFFFIFF